MNDRELPKVGTAVWIVREGKLLVGKRRDGASTGTWCPPGGHLEMYESFEACIHRETMEEAGIVIEEPRFIAYTNDFSQGVGKHYVTMHFVAEWKSGEASDVEPDKMGDWGWYAWEELPQPLFHPARIFVENGYNPLNFSKSQ